MDCPVCRIVFDGQQHYPKLCSTCGNSVCADCVRRLGVTPRCPHCRGERVQFPFNRALVEMMSRPRPPAAPAAAAKPPPLVWPTDLDGIMQQVGTGHTRQLAEQLALAGFHLALGCLHTALAAISVVKMSASVVAFIVWTTHVAVKVAANILTAIMVVTVVIMAGWMAGYIPHTLLNRFTPLIAANWYIPEPPSLYCGGSEDCRWNCLPNIWWRSIKLLAASLRWT